MSKFIETYRTLRNQPVIDLFLAKAGDKKDEIVAYAEKLHVQEGKHFERALADALETFKRV